MAFQAGTINVGGFLSCHRFVSHTTGFATHFGAEFAQGRMLDSFWILSVPIFFLLGTMISAYVVDKRIASGKVPLYSLLIFFIAGLMYLATYGGTHGWFGTFGGPAEVEPDYPLLAILCLACGIQNASITSASGAAIRTTHLTGITTDLGIGLIRIFSDGQTSKVLEYEKRATIMRIGIIIAFALGSLVAAFLFFAYKYLGFLLPAGISSFLLLLDFNDRWYRSRKAY